MQPESHDFIAIGLGPFNLSLASLCAPLPGIKAVFLEKNGEFSWHSGMLLEASTLQNSFLADLVTLADPRSEYSYLNYCKQTGRIYSCYIRENYYLTRAEYIRYCQWVTSRLSNVRLRHDVQKIMYDTDNAHYVVSGYDSHAGRRFSLRARKLVLGLGTLPRLPAFCRRGEAPYIHSADYLDHKQMLQKKRAITIIGSGQSAAEVFYDLLRDSHAHDYALTWITRASRFFQMEDTKLAMELISPDYTDYFFGLPRERKQDILLRQDSLYKGINAGLINQIYDLLDEKVRNGDLRHILATNAELRGCSHDVKSGEYHMQFHHLEYEEDFSHSSDGVIFATGYQPHVPTFLHPVRDRIRWSEDGRYDVARNYSIDTNGGEIFVQNAGLHSHGVTNPDLGFCCHRNACILRDLTGMEHYKIEQHTTLQSFRPPMGDALLSSARQPLSPPARRTA